MKQFCFIICSNSELLEAECIKYINRLYIPDGFSIDIITVHDADSIASAYNAAMKASEAEYKIYLHQDLFIVNRFFLKNILDIFQVDDNISMIGMVGTPRLSDDAIMWNGYRIGEFKPSDNVEIVDETVRLGGIHDVAAIDGAIMITAKDVEWREDIFDAFDFYDVSESFEHRRRGYRLVVPEQENVWCIHDDGGFLNLSRYNKYRKIFLDEYGADPFYTSANLNNWGSNVQDDESGLSFAQQLDFLDSNRHIYDENSKVIINLTDEIMKSHDLDRFTGLQQFIGDLDGKGLIDYSSDMLKITKISNAVAFEKGMNRSTFIDNVGSVDLLLDKYTRLELFLRRIEIAHDEPWVMEGYRFIEENDISAYIVGNVLYGLKSMYANKGLIMRKIIEYFTIINSYSNRIEYMAVYDRFDKGIW